MARKKVEKKETIIEDVPDGTLPEGANTSPGEFTLDEITRIKVYKLFPGKSKPSFCFERQDDITETELQNLYGGGSYTIEYINLNGSKRVEHWEIADKPADQSNNNKPRTIEDVQIAMLREQSQMNRDLLMAVLGRGNTSTPMSEIAQMWALIQGNSPNGNGGGAIDKMLSFLEKGIEIGATKGGDMDWKGMLVSTIKDIAPTVTQVIAQAKGVPVIEGANGSVPMIPDALLKTGIATLKRQIMGGMPVSLALDWIIANANDSQYQPFLAQIVGKSFEDLVKIDPDLANEPFNSWTRQLLAGLQEHFKATATVIEDEDEQQ